MGAGEITGLTNRSLQLLNPASRLVGKKKRQRDSGNDQRRTHRDYRNRPEGKILKYVGINPRNRTQLYYSTVKRCRECSQKGRCTRGKEYAERKKPEDEKRQLTSLRLLGKAFLPEQIPIEKPISLPLRGL